MGRFRPLFLCIFIFIVVAVESARSDESPDSARTQKDTIETLWIGLDGGVHSNNSNAWNPFRAGVQARLTFLELPLRESIRFSLALRYWHASIGKGSSSSDDSKGVEMSLPIRVVQVGQISFHLAPTLGLEGVNYRDGIVISYGGAAFLSYPLSPERTELHLRTFYQEGGQPTMIGGGAYRYSFFGISLDFHLNLASLVRIRRGH